MPTATSEPTPAHPQKTASGRPPVATKNLRAPRCTRARQTEEPPSGGPPSIRGWNLRETSHGRGQPTTSAAQEVNPTT